MKYGVQQTNNQLVIIATTNATEIIGDGNNPYRETVAVGYDPATDSLEAVILCDGNGAADDRVLADMDDDETIDPVTLYAAVLDIRQVANNHPRHSEDLHDIADYIDRQAAYLTSINEA